MQTMPPVPVQPQKLQLRSTDLPSFVHKDALLQLSILLKDALLPEQVLQVYLGMTIEATKDAVMFRYNNQLFATYCASDLTVAVAKCQCGVRNLLHDYTYVRSAQWELYFRGHLVCWQFSIHNPIVKEELQHVN